MGRLSAWMSSMLVKSVTGKASAYYHTGLEETWSVINNSSVPRTPTQMHGDSWHERQYINSLRSGRVGGPAYMDVTTMPGAYPARSKFQAITGMSYKEARDEIKRIMSSSARDPTIIENIKQKSHVHIPLRSGELMNEIFSTMRIDRSHFYSVHFFAIFNYELPPDRPLQIRGNVAHNPPDMGYGKWGTVVLTEDIPMKRVSIVYTTPMGNALYWLNDPSAMNRPQTWIDNISRIELENDYKTAFNGVVITMII